MTSKSSPAKAKRYIKARHSKSDKQVTKGSMFVDFVETLPTPHMREDKENLNDPSPNDTRQSCYDHEQDDACFLLLNPRLSSKDYESGGALITSLRMPSSSGPDPQRPQLRYNTDCTSIFRNLEWDPHQSIQLSPRVSQQPAFQCHDHVDFRYNGDNNGNMELERPMETTPGSWGSELLLPDF